MKKLASIAALFLATGTAHADVYYTMIRPLLPPLQYDHPFRGKLVVIDELSQEQIDRYCRPRNNPNVIPLGCTPTFNATDTCVIFIRKQSDIEIYSKENPAMTFENIKRHEIGHCNCWPEERSGFHDGLRWGFSDTIPWDKR